MEKGTLVEFWHNGERRLAIADRPEGKKHWIAIDARTQAHTLHPRDITYQVQGMSYQKPAEIDRFSAEVAPNIDPDSLEVAWKCWSRMEKRSIRQHWQIYCIPIVPQPYVMLHTSYCQTIRFTLRIRKEDKYEPRTTAQVAELKHQATVKRAKRTGTARIYRSSAATLAGTPVQWEDTDKAAIGSTRKIRHRSRSTTLKAGRIPNSIESIANSPICLRAIGRIGLVGSP